MKYSYDTKIWIRFWHNNGSYRVLYDNSIAGILYYQVDYLRLALARNYAPSRLNSIKSNPW